MESINHDEESASAAPLPPPPQTSKYDIVMVVISVLDFVVIFALWFLAGVNYENYSEYLIDSIQNYVFDRSLIDVFCVGVFRSLMLLFLYRQITLFYSTSWKAFAYLLPLSSLVFLIVKLALVVVGDISEVYGGKAFASAILSLSIIFSVVGILNATRIKGILDRANYMALPQEDLKEKERQTRLNEEQGKSNVSIARLAKLVRPEVKILSVALVALFINSLAQAALPFIIGVLVDALVQNDDPTGAKTFFYESIGVLEKTPEEQLNSSIILLVILFAVASVFGFIRGWLFTLAGQRVVAKLRSDLFSSIIKQEVAFFDRTRTGELTSRLTSDTQVLQTAVTSNISMLIRYSVQILLSIVILILLAWKLALVMFSVVPFVAIGAVAYGRFIQKLQKKFQDELGVATSVAEESISNVRTVRAFSKEVKIQNMYKEAIQKTYDIGKTIALAFGVFQGVIGFIPQCAIALILWYGGTLVLQGELTTGLLTSFLIYTLSVAMAFAMLSGIFGDFMQAVGASERIFQLIDRVPEIPTSGGNRIPVMKGHVQFSDVSFSYPSRSESLVLSNVNIVLQPGGVLALVGPSGGGKSTIVSLLERFYDTTEGSIYIDGVDLRQLDPEWYRANMALVSQEPVLFANTIKENITFGIDREVTQEEIEEVAKSANAHSFISTFKEGYDTQVGERGVKLSGGQKQRIAIARALLMNPKILLLDEATSALDAESEFLVQDAIEKAMKNRTVLIIAHRLSTIKNADKIAVLSGGKIAEFGSHQELMDKDGIYKKLVNRQLQTGTDSMEEVFNQISIETNSIS